jgi:hypothetical protein
MITKKSHRYAYRVHHVKKDEHGDYQSCEIGHADGCEQGLIEVCIGYTKLVLQPTGKYEIGNYLRSLPERNEESGSVYNAPVKSGSQSESFNHERSVNHE